MCLRFALGVLHNTREVISRTMRQSEMGMQELMSDRLPKQRFVFLAEGRDDTHVSTINTFYRANVNSIDGFLIKN